MLKQNLYIRSLLSLAMFFISAFGYAQSETSPPWRRLDTVDVQICFDRLPGEAPKALVGEVITDSSLNSTRFELIGFTLAGKPIYQNSLAHPTRFRAVLIAIPGTTSQLKLERPIDLESFIENRKTVTSNFCTSDKAAGYKILNKNAGIMQEACPDVGANVTMSVASAAQNTLTLTTARSSGPSVFNGLRACTEFVYGPKH